MEWEKKSKNVFYVKNIFKLDYYNLILDEFNSINNSWIFEKREKNSSPLFGELFCNVGPDIGENLRFMDASIIAKYHCKKILERELQLIRINTNIQFFGQESNFHPDDFQIEYWSFVVFMDYEWDLSWGGELTVETSPGEYLGLPFLPNCGVLFNAMMEHKGSAPNRFCNKERKTLAFLFEEL